MASRSPKLPLRMASGFAILLFAQLVFAQGTGDMKDQQCGVALVKLSPPVFAPLARQARIGGDVVIQLAIGRRQRQIRECGERASDAETGRAGERAEFDI
jgi:hypothetical protein